MALPYSDVVRSAVSLIILTNVFDDFLILYIFCRISSGSTLFTKVSVSIWERSGSVVECLTRDRGGRGFEPHRRHCVVVLEQDKFILA